MINEDDIDDDNEINHDETMKKNGRWFSDKKCKQAMIVNETNISCWILPNAEFCQVPKFSPPSTLDAYPHNIILDYGNEFQHISPYWLQRKRKRNSG